MLDPSSALVVYLSIFRFLDTSASTLDKLARSEDPSQDIIEVENAAQALKDVESKQDTSSTHPTNQSAPELQQTESEKAVPKVYERVKTFAGRLVPALQPSKRLRTESPVKSGGASKKEKGETEKLRKELETIRLECARTLIQLFSK